MVEILVPDKTFVRAAALESIVIVIVVVIIIVANLDRIKRHTSFKRESCK